MNYTVQDLIDSLSVLPADAPVMIQSGGEDDFRPAEDIDSVRAIVWKNGKVIVYIHGEMA